MSHGVRGSIDKPQQSLAGASVRPLNTGLGKENIKSKVYYVYCKSKEHHLSQCRDVAKLSKEQLKEWIHVNKCCRLCAQAHFAAQCTLKKPCSQCNGKHFQALLGINAKPERDSKEIVKQESCLANSASSSL